MNAGAMDAGAIDATVVNADATNTSASSGQQWTVPIGGGFGRVFRVGDQPERIDCGLFQCDTSGRRGGLAVTGFRRASVPGQIAAIFASGRYKPLTLRRVDRIAGHVCSRHITSVRAVQRRACQHATHPSFCSPCLGISPCPLPNRSASH